ncbi:hypothetical protein L2E82_51268 [Cichorium intybus]|nr:hypothetical protein L2E82_51268 [Cichorium intybus]
MESINLSKTCYSLTYQLYTIFLLKKTFSGNRRLESNVVNQIRSCESNTFVEGLKSMLTVVNRLLMFFRKANTFVNASSVVVVIAAEKIRTQRIMTVVVR